MLSLLARLYVVLLLLGPVVTVGADSFVSCRDDAKKQEERSKELQDIFAADQADRNPPYPSDQQERDRLRRARVGEIFGEGCINSAKDYLAAAIVFQHGDHPDHFFQTFLWSRRGVELGDSIQKRNMALGLDRYLTNTNHKQLFASQASKPGNEQCWCLEPVEKTFPEKLRKRYMGTSLKEQLAWVNTLNKGTSCPAAKECVRGFTSTPKGSVPGFW